MSDYPSEAFMSEASGRLQRAWDAASRAHGIVTVPVVKGDVVRRYGGPFSKDLGYLQPVAVDTYAVGRLVEDLVAFVAELARTGVRRASVELGTPQCLVGRSCSCFICACTKPPRLIWMIRGVMGQDEREIVPGQRIGDSRA